MSSGTPYIGSKISLVSKAEIRYEGFLYTIDQNDSTVTLAKVISLGTEDRVPGAGAVPAREEVFEYIVFRGSDIKDLHVCEGPKKVEDPAIVTHSYSQSYNPNYHRGPPFPTGGMPNFGYNPFNIPQNVPVDISHSSSRQQTPPNLPRNDRGGQNKNQSGNFQDNSRSKVRSNDGGKYKDEGYRDNRDNSSSKPSKEGRSTREYSNDNIRDEKSYKEGRDNRNRDNRDNRTRGNRADKDSYDRRDQRGSREYRDDSDNKEGTDNKVITDSRDVGDNRKNRDHRENRYNRDNRNTKDNREYRENRNNRDNRDNRYARRDNKEEDKDDQQRSGSEGFRVQSRGRGSRAGRGGSRRGVPRGGSNTRTKFTEDFDFESANAKFNKEEIEKELLKVLKKVKIKDENGSELKDMEEREMDERAPLPSPDKFYDRSKSFFDNILCEAMVPKSEDEVMTRRQEQALNAETFGSSAAHYRPGYRGRGRGRGRWRGQGRGFYRGRGNFRGSSNRRWVDYEFDYEAAGIKSKHQPLKVSNED